MCILQLRVTDKTPSVCFVMYSLLVETSKSYKEQCLCISYLISASQTLWIAYIDIYGKISGVHHCPFPLSVVNIKIQRQWWSFRFQQYVVPTLCQADIVQRPRVRNEWSYINPHGLWCSVQMANLCIKWRLYSWPQPMWKGKLLIWTRIYCFMQE